MLPTQEEFEHLLKRLRIEQTEWTTIEGKEDLALDKSGDKAYVIRHIAALLNNVAPSYLVVGIKDKTWEPIGLATSSPLRDADATQQRLNSILAPRIDPGTSVRYRTYETDNVMYGLVALEGNKAPYVICIDDETYGGERTKGKHEFIHRGAIYVRHGANSVIANRQNEILNIIILAEQIGTENEYPDEVLKKWNYIDVESNQFGHHPFSEKLAEISISGEEVPKLVTALSWVSFVFYPASEGCEIKTIALRDQLKPTQRIGRGPEWYRDIPENFVEMLFKARATPKIYTASDCLLTPSSNEITQFIQVAPSGHIEIGITYPLFHNIRNVRMFHFVKFIGCLWQMTYLAKAIYESVGFNEKIAITINLIGTNETYLDGYAHGWPSNITYRVLENERPCEEKNIQIQRSLTLISVSDGDIENMIRDVAKEVSDYYEHKYVKCFNHGTGEFPVKEYEKSI